MKKNIACNNERQLINEKTHATNSHMKKKTCHNIRQLTYEKKTTCHNIRQLTYEQTHATIKDNSHMKKSHNKRQLTYEKQHATIDKIKQLTYERKQHMPQ